MMIKIIINLSKGTQKHKQTHIHTHFKPPKKLLEFTNINSIIIIPQVFTCQVKNFGTSRAHAHKSKSRNLQ